MKLSPITNKAIQAGIIWRSLGYKSAIGFCKNNDVPVALARIAAQLQAVKAATESNAKRYRQYPFFTV